MSGATTSRSYFDRLSTSGSERFGTARCRATHFVLYGAGAAGMDNSPLRMTAAQGLLAFTEYMSGMLPSYFAR